VSEVRDRLRSNRLFVIKLAFLVAGAMSFLFSVYLWYFADRLQGIFVGIWVPSMWSLGALILSTERGEP
jgi:hypothetical protein